MRYPDTPGGSGRLAQALGLMSDASRILVAAIVAPLTPAALFAVVNVYAAAVAAIYSYIVFLILGLPAVFVLRRLGKLTILSLVLSGAGVGVVSFLCFSAGLAKLFGSPASDALAITPSALGGSLGALVAGCFGVIAGLPNLSAGQAQSGRR